ncbi:MAG: DegT/DnrJ/EryC1/StrS family aminotransferase, partial [Chloroflexota bacterium]|nr:DegT/DnrJ/EryC1/StrS family aminotransferase [Chloroflexota bacterium]
EESAAVADVLLSATSADGERVAEIEARWSAYVGVRHAVAVVNGTAARMCILAGLGIGPGDEVITVSHTANATVSSIMYTGATPVFVDIEPDTYLIDAARIETAITPRTRAIYPVHLHGLVADMDMISAIADRHGLAVVEDGGGAHGATFRGRRAGSWGPGAFGLYGVGQGGLVTTDDDRLADWVRRYRDHGRRGPQAEILGFDFHLSEVAAAIGLVGLDRIDAGIAARRAIAARYGGAFAELPIRRPLVPAGRRHVFHRYAIGVGSARDAIVADLADHGVEAAIEYPLPVHRQPYVLERGIHADLPVTEAAAAGTLSLPMYAGLTPDEEAQVVGALRAAVRRHVREPVPVPVRIPVRSASASR